MFKKTIFALALGYCLVGVAQEASDLAAKPGDADVEVKVVDVDKELGKIRRKVRKAGYTAVATNDIGANPTTRDYVINRRIAFDQADFKAKQAIAKNLVQTISSKMSSNEVASHGGLQASDVENDPALAETINKEIEKELKSMGVDLNDKAAVAKAMPKLKGKESFQKQITIASQAYLVGVSVYASASSKDKVGVLAYSSKTLRDIAAGMVNGNIPKYAPGMSVDDYFETVEDQLANTYGVRVMIDENGEPCLIAFAQREILSSESSAKENAGDAASAMIREFVGTAVMLKKSEESGRTLAYMEPVDATDNKAVATAFAKVTAEAKAEAEAIDFSGIEEFDSGIIRLPSGDKLAWAVKYWTPRAAAAATQANAQGEQQRVNLKAKGVGNFKPSKPAAKPAAKPSKRRNAGADGVSGGNLPIL